MTVGKKRHVFAGYRPIIVGIANPYEKTEAI
jgi:hypothetical protein